MATAVATKESTTTTTTTTTTKGSEKANGKAKSKPKIAKHLRPRDHKPRRAALPDFDLLKSLGYTQANSNECLALADGLPAPYRYVLCQALGIKTGADVDTRTIASLLTDGSLDNKIVQKANSWIESKRISIETRYLVKGEIDKAERDEALSNASDIHGSILTTVEGGFFQRIGDSIAFLLLNRTDVVVDVNGKASKIDKFLCRVLGKDSKRGSAVTTRTSM